MKLKTEQSVPTRFSCDNQPPRKIVVVQRRLTHYRVPFFECLRTQLLHRGVQLELAYGEPTQSEKTKGDEGVLPWAKRLPTQYWLNGKLCWLDHRTIESPHDLVVLTSENKLLSNLPQQYGAWDKRVALWGHGANLQSQPTSLRERFKRVVARQADWWFAYTDMSVPLIERTGFPRDRITVLNNSVNTSEMASMRQNVTPAALQQLKNKLGIHGNSVGIFVGSLYSEKRVDFMLEVVTVIHDRLPGFEFLVVGAGPDHSLVDRFCLHNHWAKYLGVRQGQAKVDAMALANVMINPGLVGLGLLDSFVCGVPMLTTDCGLHSPEIAYLDNGVNGVMTANTVHDYASAVVTLLTDHAALARLQSGCEVSAKNYTVENMAHHFVDGVLRCLEAPKYRGRGNT